MKFLTVLIAFFSLSSASACNDAAKVYKVCSDQEAAYQKSVGAAKEQKKMLVLLMGAEWCPWCMSLHKMLRDDPAFAGDFAKKYQLGDIAMYDGKKKLPEGAAVLKKLQLAAHDQDPKKVEGIPVLAMVNPESGKAVIISTEPLEKNTKDHKGHDPAKVLAALGEAAKALR
jgi:thioredoxin-related protein